MASLSRRYSKNVDGRYFVDDSCINCDTCRQLCTSVFDDGGGYSFVLSQPKTELEEKMTQMAIIACPTGSIGSTEEFERRIVRENFPLLLEDEVYYCGYNSPKSYGACSYFVNHSEGNWLIDSPRFSTYLNNKFKELGGIRYIFLTHRDDIADARKYQQYYENCEIIIHYYDRSAFRDADIKIKGEDETSINQDFTIIPTPGHTKGHQVLLYKNKYIFTGDHLYWRRDWERLRATRNYCWYDWNEQIESMQKLLNYKFEWVLPGHGQRIKLDAKKMNNELTWLVEQMKDPNYW